jgi:hypothetical protein
MEKLLPHPPIESGEEGRHRPVYSFKVSPEARPRFSANDMVMVNDVLLDADDNDYVKVNAPSPKGYFIHRS